MLMWFCYKFSCLHHSIGIPYRRHSSAIKSHMWTPWKALQLNSLNAITGALSAAGLEWSGKQIDLSWFPSIFSWASIKLHAPLRSAKENDASSRRWVVDNKIGLILLFTCTTITLVCLLNKVVNFYCDRK